MTIVEIDDKQYDPKLEKQSVVDTPEIQERRAPSSLSFLLQVACGS